MNRKRPLSNPSETYIKGSSLYKSCPCLFHFYPRDGTFYFDNLKINIKMDELKPILLKPMVMDYYNMLDTDEQRFEFLKELITCGFTNTEPTTEDKMLKIALKPCLESIRESRENYNRRQAKNAEYGIQGKDYGILGKEYGKLGGRPTNEFKRVLNEITSNKDLVIAIQDGTISKQEIDDMLQRYDRKTLTDVLQWIKDKYNVKR